MASIVIPKEIIEATLSSIEYDELNWHEILRFKGVLKMNAPKLAALLDVSEYEPDLELALQLVREILASGKIMVVNQRWGEGTDVWDFEAENIIDILRAHSTLLDADIPRKGYNEILFYWKEDIKDISEHHDKPVIILRSPPKSLSFHSHS